LPYFLKKCSHIYYFLANRTLGPHSKIWHRASNFAGSALQSGTGSVRRRSDLSCHRSLRPPWEQHEAYRSLQLHPRRRRRCHPPHLRPRGLPLHLLRLWRCRQHLSPWGRGGKERARGLNGSDRRLGFCGLGWDPPVS
jgi:hypothetical protein